MSEIKNLWSEELLSPHDVVLPKTILQQQADFFNKMTKNVVLAEVSSMSVSVSGEKSIRQLLKIVAPAMGDYDFDLLAIVHEKFSPYPVRIRSFLEDETFKKEQIENADELTQKLEEIFQSKKVISALQNVIAMSK